MSTFTPFGLYVEPTPRLIRLRRYISKAREKDVRCVEGHPHSLGMRVGTSCHVPIQTGCGLNTPVSRTPLQSILSSEKIFQVWCSVNVSAAEFTVCQTKASRATRGGHTLEKHIGKSEACLMYQPKTGKLLPRGTRMVLEIWRDPTTCAAPKP